MKATKLVTFILLISTAIAIPAQQPTPTKPITPLAWLIGGTWTADASNLAPGMQRIETRYTWSDNGSYIRFTTHFVSTQGTFKNYDGSFFFDPAGKTLSMWYMDAGGAITQGPVTIQGDLWQMSFPRPRKTSTASPPTSRSTCSPQIQRLYHHWSVSEKDGDSWKKLLELDYARKP